MSILLPDGIGELDTTPAGNPDWHRDHQAYLHSMVGSTAIGARGDTLMLVDGQQTVQRRQPHQVVAGQVHSHSHSTPGQVVLDLQPTMRACVVEATADINGWKTTNDTAHGAMCDVWFLIRAVTPIAVGLADIPEIISPLPPATMAAGEVWPIRWVCFPSGSGSTGGGGTSGTGAISGTVTRVGGATVEGVQVNLWTSVGGVRDTYIKSTTTSNDGTFALPTLADGEYIAEFVAPFGETWPATGDTKYESAAVTITSGSSETGVDAQLASLSGGGGGVITFNVGGSGWEWTTTDPLNPAVVTVIPATTAPPASWRWQQWDPSTNSGAGGWVDTPGMVGEPMLQYEAAANDPDGNPVYDVQQTTTIDIRVSDDGGTNWSATETITIVYDIPPA